MVGGGTPSTWNFGSTGPRWRKIADFEPIIALSTSAVTPSEKSSINANRKSTKRFPISLRWSSYVAPKSSKVGLKNAKRPISVKKIILRLKKVCYKVSLCENCQRQSCMSFIGLTNRAKMIGGGDHFYLKFRIKVTARSKIADFRSIFARSDSAVTPCEKSSININRKSTTRFSMSPRWTSYVVPKPP